MIFKEYVEIWQKEKQEFVKATTMSAYKLLIKKHLIPTFGEMELSLINNDIVSAFAFKKLDEGISKKSVQDIIICLKMIIKNAALKNLIEMPQIQVRYPKKYDNKKETLEVFSQNDYNRIISFCKENINSYNLGILICSLTGMRIGEVCGLKWKDVNFDEGTITINRTLQRIYNSDMAGTMIIESDPKTFNSQREIPIVKDLKDILRPLSKIYSEDKYIIALNQEVVEPRLLRNHYKKLLKKLHIKNLKFHGLRHSFATRLIEKGVDVKTVSSILGHSDVSITMNLYVHPTNENKKKAIMKAFRGL
jgi:Site-specific recombinase XerD